MSKLIVFSDLEKHVANSDVWEKMHDWDFWESSRREYQLEVGRKRSGWHKIVIECPPTRGSSLNFLVTMHVGNSMVTMPQIHTVMQLKKLIDGINGK